MTIKYFFKRFAYWSIPVGVYDFFLQILRKLQLQNPTVKKVLLRNRAFKDVHRGRRCFILGAGPSIKHQDLRLLRNEICISVANFFVHPDFGYIRPKYHCIPSLHPPFTEQDGMRWFRKMEPYMENISLFLGYSDKRLVEKNNIFQNRQVYYLYLANNWANSNDTNFDISRLLPGCQSVSIMALMVALYIGCREIYLLGTDHTFFNQHNGQFEYKHFYDGQAKNELGEQVAPDDLEGEFRAVAELWRQYKILRAYAFAKDIKIFNATEGGILDIFPRVAYKTLFGLTEGK